MHNQTFLLHFAVTCSKYIVVNIVQILDYCDTKFTLQTLEYMYPQTDLLWQSYLIVFEKLFFTEQSFQLRKNKATYSNCTSEQSIRDLRIFNNNLLNILFGMLGFYK